MKKEEAIKKAKQEYGLEKIFEAYRVYDYVQVTGTTGGDVLTFRFYDDGDIVER